MCGCVHLLDPTPTPPVFATIDTIIAIIPVVPIQKGCRPSPLGQEKQGLVVGPVTLRLATVTVLGWETLNSLLNVKSPHSSCLSFPHSLYLLPTHHPVTQSVIDLGCPSFFFSLLSTALVLAPVE